MTDKATTSMTTSLFLSFTKKFTSSDRYLVFEACTLLLVCWLTLFVMQKVNPRNELENYFHEKQDTLALSFLNLSSMLIIVCFGINAKFITTQLFRSLLAYKA